VELNWVVKQSRELTGGLLHGGGEQWRQAGSVVGNTRPLVGDHCGVIAELEGGLA
jgi:hypothetical protein